MKNNEKYYNIVFSCLAAVFISVPIAFVMVAINFGFVSGFLMAFLKSALVGVVISVPLANIFIPLAGKATNKILEK